MLPSTILSGILLYTSNANSTLINSQTLVRRRALSVMFNVVCYARVSRNNRLYDKSNVACSFSRCYDNSKRSLLIVSTHVLRLKAAESLLETSRCTYFTKKSGLRDVKRADFIRYWRRSGLKNPDKPKIFIKKNVRNHLYHQFYPVLAKIRIDRGLLESVLFFCDKILVHTVNRSYSIT